MKNKYLLIAALSLFLTPLVVMAEPIPKIGGIFAIAHQKCGKSINILVGEPGGGQLGRIIIGIINKKTKNVDYFLSQGEQMLSYRYSEYYPVVWDAHAREFTVKDALKATPSIAWG